MFDVKFLDYEPDTYYDAMIAIYCLSKRRISFGVELFGNRLIYIEWTRKNTI